MQRDDSLEVLGILAASMGHVPWAERLIASLEDDPRLVYRPVWNRSATIPERAALRLATPRLPRSTGSGWDLWFARTELAYSLLALRRLRQTPQRRVVHVHTQALALTMAREMARAPFVVSLDATNVQVKAAEGGSRAHDPLIWFERRALRRAAHVVGWSEHARRSAVAEYGLDTARTSVIHPAVDPRLFDIERTPGDGPVRLLFVGSDFERKGGPELLRAFAQLPVGVELDLVTPWVGSLPEGVRLHTGVRPFDERWLSLFTRASAFVMPTRYEAFGLAFAEAQAAGLPVVATAVQAVPEIVEDGVTGLLVAAGKDAALLEALLAITTGDRRCAMSAAARARARVLFDAQTNGRRMADVFLAAAGRA